MTQKPSQPKALPARAVAKYFEAKLQAEWGPHEVRRRREAGADVVILDVRDGASYAEEHIPGALNIPLAELAARAKELPKNKDIVAYCWDTHCALAPKAALWLAQKGFKVHELAGGIDAWKDYDMPVESRRVVPQPSLAN